MSADTFSSAPPLVTVDNVTLRLGDYTVFSGLNLCVRAGKHLALAGPNGAGKSTLLRLLAGELRPAQADEGARDAPGTVIWHFGGVAEPSALAAREHARLVSPGQQRNYSRQGWRVTGEEIILSGLDNAVMVYGEVSSRHYARVAELAGAAGAAGLLSLTAPAMSQGQLRLALLLRALISRPALLLLDEPFDGLDAEARAGIGAAIGLAARSGSTVVVAAHRPRDIPVFIESTLLLRGGGIFSVRREEAFAVGEAKEDPAEVPRPGLLAGAAYSKPQEIIPEQTSPPSPPQSKSLGEKGMGVRGKGKRPLFKGASSPSPENSSPLPPVLELCGVDVYVDRTLVLSGIDWRIMPGEQWVVSGPNGSGKSTLLRLLYGEEFAAWGGEVRWSGAPRPALEELRAGVGYVSDRLQDLYDYDLTAEEVVISGLRGSVGLYHEPAEEERALARRWLERMGLKGREDRPFFSLSSGTARRVLLARALASSPPVLLLDEPCSGLDPRGRKKFLDALPLLAARGVTLVHVSHHPGDQTDLFTHELRLEKGRMVFAGPRR